MDRTIPALPLWTAPGSTPRRGALARLLALMVLHRSRLSLAALDDHLLRDVGLSRAEARAEARRPAWKGLAAGPWHARDAHPWDAPAHWLR